MVSQSSVRLMRLVAASALVVCSVVSAQGMGPNKCIGNNCMPGGSPNYPQQQVDVNALAGKVAALEQKLAALEAKLTAQDTKQAATDANVTKLLTHTHDINTNFGFSSTVVKDINMNSATVIVPVPNFGTTSGVSGKPKLN